MVGSDRGRDVVVIGGSAGALEPLKSIIADLPADLPAAVLVVLHLGPDRPSLLAPILNRAGGPRVVNPTDGDPVKPAYVYVATPDHHLEVTHEGIRLENGPRVNGTRPAIDVLFQSAAATYGAHVVGVILSGGLDDGSAGLASIKDAGGIAIVQDPDDAVIASMPKNAMGTVVPDHVVPAGEIAALIKRAVNEPAHDGRRSMRGGLEMPGLASADDVDGDLTGLTCPDCHGAIWMRDGPGEVTFECRVGHRYAPASFFQIQSETVENALWAGVRSLEEQASLAEVMANRAVRSNDEASRDRFARRRRIATTNAGVLRRLLTERD